jgi:hypothetical protein
MATKVSRKAAQHILWTMSSDRYAREALAKSTDYSLPQAERDAEYETYTVWARMREDHCMAAFGKSWNDMHDFAFPPKA